MIKVKMKIIISDEENVLSEVERVVEVDSEEFKMKRSRLDEKLWMLSGKEVDEIYDYIINN
jgi:hypothetical protein